MVVVGFANGRSWFRRGYLFTLLSHMGSNEFKRSFVKVAVTLFTFRF